MIKYVLFGSYHKCFGLPSCIKLCPELKLNSAINYIRVLIKKINIPNDLLKS